MYPAFDGPHFQKLFENMYPAFDVFTKCETLTTLWQFQLLQWVHIRYAAI